MDNTTDETLDSSDPMSKMRRRQPCAQLHLEIRFGPDNVESGSLDYTCWESGPPKNTVYGEISISSPAVLPHVVTFLAEGAFHNAVAAAYQRYVDKGDTSDSASRNHPLMSFDRSNPLYRIVPAPATEEEDRARTLKSLDAFSDYGARSILAPRERQTCADYLRQQCAKLDIPVPDWLTRWGKPTSE